ncbi:hypothetical protein [Microbacterium deminutum]|uniref:Lipoprotein n=1 Tax=Microbacterium deminutum TaxID=344164 RepID=A0ABN2R2K4_9MICO
MSPKSAAVSGSQAFALRWLGTAAALALVLPTVVGCDVSNASGRAQEGLNAEPGIVCAMAIPDPAGRQTWAPPLALVGRWQSARGVAWYLEISLSGRFSFEADQRVVDAGVVTVAGDELTFSSYQGGRPRSYHWSTTAGPARTLHLDGVAWIATAGCLSPLQENVR